MNSVNDYLKNITIPMCSVKRDVHMNSLLKRIEHIDEKIDEFIFYAFNNFTAGEHYDVANDDDYMELFEKSTTLLEAINYIKKWEDDNFGEFNFKYDEVKDVARMYALIWAMENRDVIEPMVKKEEKEFCFECDSEYDKCICDSCDSCMKGWDAENKYGRCICICHNCEDLLRNCKRDCC